MGEDPFRQIVDHLTEVVWMLDADLSDIVYVNPAYESVVGVSPDCDPATVVHPDNQAAAREWLAEIGQDIAAGETEREYVLQVQVGSGDDERWLETIGVPVREDGEVVGLAGLSSDVTEYVEREQQLEAQVERLDQFASMVSHDLRNPLSVAMSHLELLQANDDSGSVETALESLERIEAITDDLLTVVRGGDDVDEIRTVDLAAISRNAWAEIDTREASLHETDAGRFQADPGKLQTLLENLFTNAIGHGGADVTVMVGSLPDGFYVADDGSGIEPADRESVFEHGYTSGYGGTGVGLTIVDRIATAHGWDISVTDSEDGGARFEFRTGAE
ncbi:PAS domain-containing sensor histidine kinase [Halorhabdus salina]|uniref:PAS domain-containing sensor histidine kinase n=1 Tax=Halorhabdus salina TaxID=2750670 RepID=UPI0015EF943C|nr:PAS domain-containing sensor histidine kinase [Halorhabdus salina]